MSAPGVTFARLRAEVRNWYTVGLLASIVMPTRIPPRRGLAGTWFGARVVTFQMRDGSKVTCRLQDSGDMISVYLDQDYAPFDLAWAEFRSVIDVGATTGCFTLWALQRAPEARVVAVEPNQNVFPFLLKNVEANGLAGRVRTVPTALGARSGHGAVVDRTYSTLATVVPQVSGHSPSVRVITLGQLMADCNLVNCDLLKMDCEGAEYDILLTSADDVLRRIGAIVCEFHPIPGRSVNELSDRLTAGGFNVSVFGAGIGFIVAKR